MYACIIIIIAFKTLYFFYRTHYGDNTIDIEMKKKENRSIYGKELTMKEFLDVSLLGYYSYSYINWSYMYSTLKPKNVTSTYKIHTRRNRTSGSKQLLYKILSLLSL